MENSALNLFSFLSSGSVLLYLSYFIAKTYQIKRLIQISKEYKLHGDFSAAINALIIGIPIIYKSLLFSDKEIVKKFTQISFNFSLLTPLFLGIIICNRKKIRMNIWSFYKCVGLSILCHLLILFSFILRNHLKIDCFITVIMFYYVIFCISKKQTEQFNIVMSVSVEIQDYASKFTQARYFFERILIFLFDNLFGKVPLLDNRNEFGIRKFSLYFIAMILMVILRVQNILLIILCVVISLFCGVYLSKITEKGRNPIFTKIFCLISSSIIIHSIVYLMNLLFDFLIINNSFFTQFLKLLIDFSMVYVSAFCFLKFESFSLFVTSIYISNLLILTGYLSYMSILETFIGRSIVTILQQYKSPLYSTIFYISMYFILLLNYEIHRYKFKQDLGIVLISNVVIFVILFDYCKV